MCLLGAGLVIVALVLFLPQGSHKVKTVTPPPSFSTLRAALSHDCVKIIFRPSSFLGLRDVVIHGAAKDRLRRLLSSRVPDEISADEGYIDDESYGILHVETKDQICVVHVFRDSFTPEEHDIYNPRYRIRCPELFEFLKREGQKGDSEGNEHD